MAKIPKGLETFRQKAAALDSELPASARAFSFFTAGLAEKFIAEDLKQALLSVLEKGSTSTDFVTEARKVLDAHGMLLEDFPDDEAREAYNNDVRNLGGLNRLKLIYRVNNEAAYSLANWRREMTPQRLREAPAFRFVRLDGAVEPRPLHVANEEEIRFKWDWAFWAEEQNSAKIGGFEVPWAPFGFNSYMQQEPVEDFELPTSMQDAAEKLTDAQLDGIIKEADARFGASLGKMYEGSKGAASVKDLGKKQVSELVDSWREEGINVDFDDGKVSIDWDASKKPTPTPTPTPKTEHQSVFEMDALPPAKTRKQSVDNTKLLLDGRDGVVKWGSNIKKEQIDEFNNTLFRLEKKYPTRSILNIGSYKDKSDLTAAHAGRITLQVNHDGQNGGIHGLINWKPNDKEKIDRQIKLYQDSIKEWEEYRKTASTSEKRRATGSINRLNEIIEFKKESRKYERHNVGASSDGAPFDSVINHEYAHTIHRVAEQKTGIMADDLVWDDFIQARANNDIYKISQYANTNPREFFAECFAMRELGEKLPDYISKMITRIINLSQS